MSLRSFWTAGAFALSLALTATVLAPTAHAAEPDTVLTFSGDTTDDSLSTFGRPFTVGDGTSGSCSISGLGSAVRYETTSFTPATSGNFSIEITSTDGAYDEYVHLYDTSFNPTDQCVNLIALDDDGGGGSLIENVALTGGTTYIIVVSGFNNLDFGPYDAVVTQTPEPVTVFNFSGDTSDDPFWARPNSFITCTGGSSFADSVRYEVTSFTVDNDSEYAIETDYPDDSLSEWDGYIYLYADGFDPASPCDSLITGDDDFGGATGGGSRIESVDLVTGTTYFVVVTGFGNDDAGTYTGIVEDLCPAPPPALDYEITATNTTSLTVAPGGSVSFSYTIDNNTASSVTGDLFYTASLGGPTLAQGIIINDGTLAGNSSFNGNYTQSIPSTAPPNTYTYCLRIGSAFGVTFDLECFALTVTGPAPRIAEVEVKDAAYFEALEAQEKAYTSGTWTVSGVSPLTAVRTDHAEVRGLSVYPNPFNPTTQFTFQVPAEAAVTLAVYDVLGREVARLVDSRLDVGTHTASFDARDLASGMYLYRLSVGEQVQTGRITLLK